MAETSVTREELIDILGEECAEVIVAASKCRRFGYDTLYLPEYGHNDLALAHEMGDVQGMLDELLPRMSGIARAVFSQARSTKMERILAAKLKFSPGGKVRREIAQVAREILEEEKS